MLKELSFGSDTICRKESSVNKNYENIHRYDFLTKDLLEEEYVHNKLTDKQIAEKYNMPSKVVVWRKRKKFGIENRFSAKSNKNAAANRKFEISKIYAESLLAKGKSFKEIAKVMGCSVIVAKRRFKELGLSKEQPQLANFSFFDIVLSDYQKQFLTGSLMGDGGITPHNAYYCTHSVKQSDYFFHKMDVLSSISSNKFQRTKGVAPNGTKTEGIHFATGSHRFCEELRTAFYPNGKKIFPYDFIREHLSETGLAYWFMDDGSYHQKNQAVSLHTEGFNFCDLISMRQFFKERWGWDCRANNKRSHQFYLRFIKEDSQKFIEKVRSHIVPSMLYKTGDTEAYLKWKTAH